MRSYRTIWAALAFVLYAVLADLVVETFLSGSPLRWEIAVPVIGYLALCLAAWRFAPVWWRRLDWAHRAGISLIVLIGGLGVTAWLPGGVTEGVRLSGGQTGTVFAMVSALAVALAGALLGGNRSLPTVARAVGALLAAYGIAGFVLGAVAGTPYPALFHGASQWSRLPYWLQGAAVGSLFVVPVALLVDVVKGFSRAATTTLSTVVIRVAALAMSLVVALAALRGPGTASGTTQIVDAAGNASTGASESGSPGASGDVTPADDAGYQKASKALGHLNAATDVLNSKVDHSLFEIDALAGKLGSDPTVIFHFVRDEIHYEPYLGALRGPLGTLICRAGNSLDRSLLLATLLQKIGLTVQISNGKLGDADARTLVSRVFESRKSAPNAIPGWSDLAPDLSEALGVEQQQVRRRATRDSALVVAGRGRLMAYVDSQGDLLTSLLTKAGVDPTAVTPPNRLVADAQDHYWVRYQNGSGQWIDLDPAFANAEPGQTKTPSTRTFGLDAVPEELYHHLRISLTLRSATGTRSSDRSDQVLLDQEMRIADLQGKAVTVASQPVSRVDPLKKGVTLADVVDGAKVYQTTLLVGDQMTPGKGFDLQGRIGGIATPEGVDVEQAGGIGGANGGLLGGIGAATGGGDTAATRTSGGGWIVGEWADYKLTSPGPTGAPARVRSYHRDIIAPVTVTSWSPDSPEKPQTAPTRLGLGALRRGLMWSEQLLPVSGTTRLDYAGYVSLQALISSRPAIDALARASHGLPVERAALAQSPQAPAASLLLAAAAMARLDGPVGSPASTVRSYFAEPGLIAYERRMSDSVSGSGRREGFDIIAYSPRVVTTGSGTANADAARRAGSLQVRRGVLVTRLEAVLSAGASGSDSTTEHVANATNVFAAAQREAIPIAVLRPGDAGTRQLARLSLSQGVKAELAADLGAGETLIIPSRSVNSQGRQQIGWWRWRAESGEMIGVMPGERGQTMTETITQGLEALNSELCFMEVGKMIDENPDNPFNAMSRGVVCVAQMGFGWGAEALGGPEQAGTIASIAVDAGFILEEWSNAFFGTGE
jgi:hypothetical protein